MAWLRALGVRCPTCGALPHHSCQFVYVSHGRLLSPESPHLSRITLSQEKARAQSTPSTTPIINLR